MEESEKKEVVDDGMRYLSLEKDNKIYQFLFYRDSTIGEMYDVLTHMKNFVFQKICQENQDKSQELPKNG